MVTTNRGSEYWIERTLQLEDALNSRALDYYYELEAAYVEASRRTAAEILVLYNRMAGNNNITLTEARRLLTTKELQEFKWSLEEYIETGRANKLNPAWTTALENASLRYRISRLEAMRIQMQNQVEMLMGNELDGVHRLMSNMYTEGYYRTGHMLEVGFGIHYSFAKLDTRQVEKVLAKPWLADGLNFSERIWGKHRPELVSTLHKELTQSIIRGEKPDRLVNLISNKFNVAKHNAQNLVMTESAYFSNVAQQECYDELDVDQQMFMATLDTRTSEVCRSMDGKVFKSSEIQIGVNAPPLHCRCRSVMVPYFDDIKGERAARDKDGNGIYVPFDMTYNEWYEKFIK
jgi:SPP1 gp7 family putative phage head morphogenesis protein